MYELGTLSVGTKETAEQVSGSAAGACGFQFDGNEFGALEFVGAEHGDVGQRAADHGDFVAGVEARAGLAVLVDFVGHGVAVGDAEAEVLEVVGDAGEEADAT